MGVSSPNPFKSQVCLHLANCYLNGGFGNLEKRVVEVKPRKHIIYGSRRNVKQAREEVVMSVSSHSGITTMDAK